METISLWEAISTREFTYPELTEDIELDVAIIGGGITGITIAAQLVATGKTVGIFEANSIGGATTGHSTGNLYVAVQPMYQNIINKFDFQTAKVIADSRAFAIDYIEKTVKNKNINCQFTRRPWYAYTYKNDAAANEIEKEVDFFERADIPIDYTEDLPLGFKFTKAIIMENQARFNPLQYVISMASYLADKGCLIFENTRILEVKENKKCTLETLKAKVIAKDVVIATHSPIGIHSTQMWTAPYRSYVVSAEIENNDYPEGHFWDLDEPSHATCTHAISENYPELLMVAGSHHKTGQGNSLDSHYKKLEQFLKANFNITEFRYRWSAQHFQSADNVPYIGLAGGAKHTYLATGFWADGLIYGTLAGVIISDVLLGIKAPFTNTYQSTRHKPIASAGFIFKENTNVLLQYLKDYPLLSSKTFDDIKAGEGKIVEIEREKFAVSRDEDNKLHKVSAVCTHMKCIVNWNDAEKTWDCPCHGSRFTCDGKVIDGPATQNLELFPVDKK